MSDLPYGVRTLPELYKEWASVGMIANIGGRLVEVGSGTLVLEGNLTVDAHSFPTSRGPIVHGGAIATLADETLASVAYTLAEEGETTATADLRSITTGPESRAVSSAAPRCAIARGGLRSARRPSSRTMEPSLPRRAR